MRLGVVALVAAVPLFLGGCVYADIPVTLDSTVTVLDNATGKPVAGASVTVYASPDRAFQATAVTGADGVVHIPPVLRHGTRLGPRPYPFTDDGIRVTAPGYRTFDLSATAIGAIPKRCEILRLGRDTEPAPKFPQFRDCNEPLNPTPSDVPTESSTQVIAELSATR